MVQYDDYEQIAGIYFKIFQLQLHLKKFVSVADLPGLISGSHKNKGLGIQFLKHTERCMALIFVVDVSLPNPWENINALKYELTQFNEELGQRPNIIIANKIDLLESEEPIEILRKETDMKVISISAKLGTNITEFLLEIRRIYDENKEIEEYVIVYVQ